jgi:hypothetical protein
MTIFATEQRRPVIMICDESGAVQMFRENFEQNLQAAACWEDTLAKNPELITDAVLTHCREIAERWAQLAEDLAATRERREGAA